MSDFVYLTGKASWAKVYPENRDMEGFEGAYKDCNGAYTINMDLDDVSLERLKEAGSKLKGRQDGTFMFKRKHEVTNKDGEIIEAFSGPPQVIMEDVDGEMIQLNHEEHPIGNGSEVEVAISVMQDKKKPSIVYTRLEGVKVLELVEFKGEEDSERELPF